MPAHQVLQQRPILRARTNLVPEALDPGLHQLASTDYKPLILSK
jgi:hypothetical protein